LFSVKQMLCLPKAFGHDTRHVQSSTSECGTVRS
jgi:hypothetical protein